MITLALILQADARQLTGHQATNLIRMTDKTDLRPHLDLPALAATTPEEQFQNQILRPILKLQNELYLALFADYTLRHNKDFPKATPAQKRNFVTDSLQKDAALKNTFIGITIGMLTTQELEVYLQHSRNYNRRITTMIAERIVSQLQ